MIPDVTYFTFYLFCFVWAIPICAQDYFLALCSGVNPDDAQGIIYDTGLELLSGTWKASPLPVVLCPAPDSGF